MKTYDFIVMGAGVAGLGFAKRISEAGHSVLVLEKEAQIGGLARTVEHSGFYLDFCAHRFHTGNPDLLKEILALPNVNMKKHIKKSRIYMFGKYLKYPFEIQNLLRAMPLHQSFICGVSFFWNLVKNKFRKKPEITSYKDWFIYFYGKQLYNVMCYPYTSKIWHMDPSKLSADWADQRFQGEKMAKLIKRILKKIITLDFSKYDLEDDALAPDGGEFYYPETYFQALSDSMAAVSKKNGGEVVTEAAITGISKKDKTISYEVKGKKITASYKNLISTIPLHGFYHLQEKKDKKIEKTLSQIKYMSIIFVYTFVDKKQISNDHWLYFPDKDIIFNRAVEFSNWSKKMCPPGKTSVCFDITCFKDDDIWKMTDEQIAQRVIDDADRIDYFDKEECSSHFVLRLNFAYPVYDTKYKEKLDELVSFFQTDDCYLLGRTGIFRYNNSDNSIEMAFQLADNFINEKEDKSIYEYSIKKVSY